MHLVIDRSKWMNYSARVEALKDLGGAEHAKVLERMGSTCLLNDNGNMCCLGFMGIAGGLSPERIRSLGIPNKNIEDGYPEWIYASPADGRDVMSRLIVANDSPGMTLSERETEITTILAEHGWTVEFTGEMLRP